MLLLADYSDQVPLKIVHDRRHRRTNAIVAEDGSCEGRIKLFIGNRVWCAQLEKEDKKTVNFRLLVSVFSDFLGSLWSEIKFPLSKFRGEKKGWKLHYSESKEKIYTGHMSNRTPWDLTTENIHIRIIYHVFPSHLTKKLIWCVFLCIYVIKIIAKTINLQKNSVVSNRKSLHPLKIYQC